MSTSSEGGPVTPGPVRLALVHPLRAWVDDQDHEALLEQFLHFRFRPRCGMAQVGTQIENTRGVRSEFRVPRGLNNRFFHGLH